MNQYIELTNFGYDSQGGLTSFEFKLKNSATLTSVYVMNQDTYSESETDKELIYDSSHTTLLTYTSSTSTWATNTTFLSTAHTTSLTIDDIVFLKITVSVSSSSASALSGLCGEDDTTVLIPLFNLVSLRAKALNLIDDLCDDCKLPKKFIDAILNIDVVETALRNKKFAIAVKFFKKFMGTLDVSKAIGGCRCGCR